MFFLFPNNLTENLPSDLDMLAFCGNGDFCPKLVLSSGLRFFSTLFGLNCNAFLIWTTLKNKKKFKDTIHILLLLSAVCDFVYLLFYFFPFALALTGKNVIPLQNCFQIIAIPAIGMFSSLWLTLFIGIDRLLNVLFPMSLPKLASKRVILSITFFFIFCYIFYSITFAYLIVSAQPDLLVLCGIFSIYYPERVQLIMFRNGFVINSVTLAIYLSLWIVLQSKVRNSILTDSILATKRIFGAILSIMLMIVSMWLASALLFFLTKDIAIAYYQMFIYPDICTLTTVVATSSNMPLLYNFSSDYKEAFRREFHALRQSFIRLIFFKRMTSSVTPTATAGSPAVGVPSYSTIMPPNMSSFAFELNEMRRNIHK